ncbi:hypothetical protein O181_130682 [Austropuccinia psidii MF-1]|uniref:Uncharacterized protein n=1 Tax=Austropuccinia psidii MF-1 TaxID=1389203 RepID=A0A9Q3L1M4_9BASI|nr:hypothetical protein [Austropuccinia psidii MF-1]
MAAKKQEWELLPDIWICTMNSHIQMKKLMGPENTEELLRGRTPMSCKGKIQQIRAWLKNKSMLSKDQKKKLAQGKDKSPVEAPQEQKSSSTSAKQGKGNPKEQSEGQEKGKGKDKIQVEQALPTESQNLSG